jgi:hypothetical protein
VVRGATGTATFENCQFISNTATSGGGGLNCNNSAPVLVTDCTFTTNVAVVPAVGGGIEVIGNNTCTVQFCSFEGNTANQGGGIDAVTGGVANVSDCTFTGNHGSNAGGGVSVRTANAMAITDCIFNDNTAGSFGGAINLLSANALLTVADCDFDGNEALQGGALNLFAANTVISGCSITNNTATGGGQGGGIHNGSGVAGSVAVGSTTLCGNSTGNTFGGYTDNGGNAISDSCKPAVPGDTDGNGIVNVDDLLTIINGWGNCPTPPALCPGDVDHNGLVNVDDLLLVINNWG